MKLFDKQFKILLEDIRRLVVSYSTERNKKPTLEKIDYTLGRYSLKTFLPTDYIITLFHTYIYVSYGEKILKKDKSFL